MDAAEEADRIVAEERRRIAQGAELRRLNHDVDVAFWLITLLGVALILLAQAYAKRIRALEETVGAWAEEEVDADAD